MEEARISEYDFRTIKSVRGKRDSSSYMLYNFGKLYYFSALIFNKKTQESLFGTCRYGSAFRISERILRI